jgi:environmental stress-induced protein Ves
LSLVRHLRASDSRRVPWKNGRGFTEELALWPAGASFEKADFDWRISKAGVEEDGPFSSFPGIERVLVVTEGAGIVLDHGASAPRRHLAPLIPYRFSGDWPTSAELVAGRIADFNVLCRRGVARAEVEVWKEGIQRRVELAEHEQLFLHVLSGSVEALDREVARGESVWVRGEGAVCTRCRGTAVMVCIRSA